MYALNLYMPPYQQREFICRNIFYLLNIYKIIYIFAPQFKFIKEWQPYKKLGIAQVC